MRIKAFFRWLLRHRIEKKDGAHEPIELVHDKIGSVQQRAVRRDSLLSGNSVVVRRAGAQAVKQDIGKYMKHGRQARVQTIRERNIERRRSTMGYGLRGKFRPRPAFEKKQWKLDEKPGEED